MRRGAQHVDISWDLISKVLPTLDLVSAIEEGFVAYSQGSAHVAPVSELRILRGELHIKSGYISGKFPQKQR